MRHRTPTRPFARLTALCALSLAALCSATIATAGKPLNFTIKAFHDGEVSDPDTFTATGAIEDSGYYTVEWYEDEELFPAGWYLFEFSSEQGTFLVGWVPEFAHGYIEENVAFPVELFGGTGAYVDVYGTGTLKVRAKDIYVVDSQGGLALIDRTEHITIKGTLE